MNMAPAGYEAAGTTVISRDTIAPGVVINGVTYYPTGLEWLLAFAIAGCKWAVDALPDAIKNYNENEIQKNLGAGI